MRLLSLLILVVSFSVFARVPEELLEFFKREGYVVKKEKDRVILDLPKGKAFKGELFEVIQRGEPLVHPVTKEVLGYEEKDVGTVEVSEPKEKFSVARIIRDEGIKPGDKAKLKVGSVCYVGGEEGFYALSSVVENLKRDEEGCEYIVRELEGGYGVSFKGKPVAFFPYSARVPRGAVFEDYAVEARLVRSLDDLPLSADVCRLFGGSKDYLIVLYSDKLKVYEVLKTDMVEITSYALPTGYPVGVVCYETQEGGVVLVNTVSDGSANSGLYKPVGNALVLVEENIPYIFGIFYEKGRKVLVGQEFGKGATWGEVYTFDVKDGKLVKGDALSLPPDFRIDGASRYDELLVFVDSERRLRVFVGNEEVLSEDGFGVSYTTASIPGVYDYGEGDKYYFYVRPNFAKVFKEILPLVAKNKSSSIFELVGFTKFTEGELWTVIRRKGKVYEAIKLKGRKFEEAIQAIVKDSRGRLFVITGSKGTIPIQNRGEIYRIEISPL
ncbi:MAG: hypothetical protein GXO04_02030 [Aquificae bacterium]|nr:hypothetical protein [Aquificota bacterium]